MSLARLALLVLFCAVILVLPLVTTTARAQSVSPVGTVEAYEDWGVVPSTALPGGYIALTRSSEGFLLGALCNTSRCLWVLTGQSVACREGAKYPVLLTSATGTAAVSVACAPREESSGTWYDAIFDDPNAVRAAVQSGGVVAVAFALKSGEFQVLRFSTNGAANALGRAQDLARGNQGRRVVPAAPRDQRL
jgi:hypothetical protein